jgi:hypothetical protein
MWLLIRRGITIPTVMFQERVRYYSAWRSGYDGNAGRRAEFGGTSRVYHNADDENDLLVMADFADEAREREFVEVVRKVQEDAGVIMSTISVRFLPTD